MKANRILAGLLILVSILFLAYHFWYPKGPRHHIKPHGSLHTANNLNTVLLFVNGRASAVRHIAVYTAMSEQPQQILDITPPTYGVTYLQTNFDAAVTKLELLDVGNHLISSYNDFYIDPYGYWPDDDMDNVQSSQGHHVAYSPNCRCVVIMDDPALGHMIF